MNLVFAIIALITLASAIAAMCLRNLVHCVLCLTVTFTGIAMTYLQLSAQFVGFSQIMVYVGAVSVLVIFALLMTRGGNELNLRDWNPRHWLIGLGTGLLTFGVMATGIFKSSLTRSAAPDSKTESVKTIGESLLNEYVLPLEALALLLTVALIGAALLAMPERKTASSPQSDRPQTKGDPTN
jgi:NADH-quinone oxidoreductase subunit J